MTTKPGIRRGAAKVKDPDQEVFCKLVAKMSMRQMDECTRRVTSSIPNWRHGEWTAKVAIAEEVIASFPRIVEGDPPPKMDWGQEFRRRLASRRSNRRRPLKID